MPDPIFFTFCALWPDLCKMGPKSAPGGSKFDPGGSRIDPGGSKIDPGGLPKRPRRLKNRHRRLLEGSWVFLGGSSGVPGGSWRAFLQENAPFWRSKIGPKVRFFDVFWNSLILGKFERRKCKNPRVFTLSHLEIKENHLFKTSKNTRRTSVSPWWGEKQQIRDFRGSSSRVGFKRFSEEKPQKRSRNH